MKALLIFLPVLALASSCARPRPVAQRAEVQYVNAQNGVLTVSAVGSGGSASALQENAERNALEALLFRGIPGSQQHEPLISEDQQAVYRTQPNYLRSFFNDKQYRRFITRSEADSRVETSRQRPTDGRGKTQHWLIDINLAALRRDLEANQVIRKFGY